MKVLQECFKTIKDFNSNPKYRKGDNNPGVYMWGFSLEKTDYTVPSSAKMFFPYYVGKVETQKKCMYARTQEHLCSLIGGNISIFDICSMVSKKSISPIGKTHKSYQTMSKNAKKNGGIGPSLPDSKFEDLLYFPEGVHRMLDFSTDLGLQKQIDWMLRHFCITFFSLETYNKLDVKELEKYIGGLVGYDTLNTKPYTKPNLIVEIIDAKKNIILNDYDDLFKHCR